MTGGLPSIVRRCSSCRASSCFSIWTTTADAMRWIRGQSERLPGGGMGSEFTANDFRTWGATLRAIALMAATPVAGRRSERALRSGINAAGG